VSLTAVQCRQYADECITMAEHAGRENAASLHRMAETWLELAEHLLTQERPVIGCDQNAHLLTRFNDLESALGRKQRGEQVE